MEKYAVQEVEEKDMEKKASDGCPKCGHALERHGDVLLCPNCGTEPFEEGSDA